MAGKVYLAPHLSIEELERRYKAATDGIERSHLQIIWLLSQGHAARTVASVTGYSPTWISKIVWRYNDHGVAGLGDRRHDNPGAATLLDEAQRQRLRATLAEPPPDRGQWTGRKVAQWMTGQLGRLVSPQRGIEYLRRLGLTPQVPRPCHIGAAWIEQHKFKKSSRRGSSSLPALKPRYRLRSGAVTSIGSG
jgi:transposase